MGSPGAAPWRRALSTLEIDGSFGEGGGQTIRIATSFSIVFSRPIHVTSVRAGRMVPGLRPQHASTLRILGQVSGGAVEGGSIGSTEFTFTPGHPESRVLSLDMGTAASITLVLQALVPAISLSGVGLEIDLVGGTDVPWSPTLDYISTLLAPSLRRIGIVFSVESSRRGYYPNGGGRVRARIEPASGVRAIDLTTRSPDPPIAISSRAGMLPARVPEQQAAAAKEQLGRHGLSVGEVEVGVEESSSPGSSILVSSVDASCFIGGDSIGVKGKPAVRVGSEAAARFSKALLTGACVDSHLADMLGPLLCLADGRSRILIPELTNHLRTSLYVAQRFVDAEYRVEPLGGAQLLTIEPHKQNL